MSGHVHRPHPAQLGAQSRPRRGRRPAPATSVPPFVVVIPSNHSDIPNYAGGRWVIIQWTGPLPLATLIGELGRWYTGPTITWLQIHPDVPIGPLSANPSGVVHALLPLLANDALVEINWPLNARIQADTVCRNNNRDAVVFGPPRVPRRPTP